MNADERNLLAKLNAAVDDDGEDGGPSTGSRRRTPNGTELAATPSRGSMMDGDEDAMAAKRTAGRTAWDTTSTDDRQPLQVRIESHKVVVKRRTRAFDFDKILRLSVRDAQILASQLAP